MQVTIDITLIGRHINQSMSRQTEQDNLFLTSFLCLHCLTNRSSNSMTTLWSRNNTLCAGKKHTSLKRLRLRNIHTIHISVLDQLRNNHTGTMITQTASMDIRRLEIMTQGVHWKQWCITSLITKVVFKLTTSQLRAAFRFCCNKFSILSILNLMTHEREGDSTKVTTTTKTSYHSIRILTSHSHLLFCLQTNDCLMKSHVI